MPRKKRKDREFDDEWDDEIMDLESELENISVMFEELKRRILSESSGDEPYIYGFSVKIDPEGKADIEEFGDVPSFLSADEMELCDEEFLIDIIKEKGQIRIVIEAPGIEREDMGIRAHEKSVEIKFQLPGRSYRKKIKLPCTIKPETAVASCKNGVIEIKVKRTPYSRRGFEVPFE